MCDCAICLEKVESPITLNCKHVFCEGCITVYEQKGGRVCPYCRSSFSIRNYMSLRDQKTLVKLKMSRFCNYHDDDNYDIKYITKHFKNGGKVTYRNVSLIHKGERQEHKIIYSYDKLENILISQNDESL